MKNYLQCFKLFFFSTSIFFIMFAFMITPTHAGSMKGWVEATFSSMDSPLIKTMDLYNMAIDEQYRFFSYGDVSLLL